MTYYRSGSYLRLCGYGMFNFSELNAESAYFNLIVDAANKLQVAVTEITNQSPDL